MCQLYEPATACSAWHVTNVLVEPHLHHNTCPLCMVFLSFCASILLRRRVRRTSIWWAQRRAPSTPAARHMAATTWAPTQAMACLCMQSSGTASTQAHSCPAVQTGASRCGCCVHTVVAGCWLPLLQSVPLWQKHFVANRLSLKGPICDRTCKPILSAAFCRTTAFRKGRILLCWLPDATSLCLLGRPTNDRLSSYEMHATGQLRAPPKGACAP